MLDIAIPQDTGFPAKFSEQCLCPEGYDGQSCEICARGFYRDPFDRSMAGTVGNCKKCPCNENEQSCNFNEGKVVCLCKDGFEGENCENPSVNQPGTVILCVESLEGAQIRFCQFFWKPQMIKETL